MHWWKVAISICNRCWGYAMLDLHILVEAFDSCTQLFSEGLFPQRRLTQHCICRTERASNSPQLLLLRAMVLVDEQWCSMCIYYLLEIGKVFTYSLKNAVLNLLRLLTWIRIYYYYYYYFCCVGLCIVTTWPVWVQLPVKVLMKCKRVSMPLISTYMVPSTETGPPRGTTPSPWYFRMEWVKLTFNRI